MIKSMTGYGLANLENEEFVVQVEIKTLNSKFLDLSIKSPKQFSDRELEIRNIIAGILERGKVSITIEFASKKEDELPIVINEALFRTYYSKYREMAATVGERPSDIFKLALQSPNVCVANTEKPEGSLEWETLKEVLTKASVRCDGFRKQEGEALLGKFRENLTAIADSLEKIKTELPRRKEKLVSKIRQNFSEWMEDQSFDENRFEQELIYYFEKLDVSEEITRLHTHLDLFSDVLEANNSQGKKLGFISQEIGREINTIGSKANDAEIQRLVINMKDELEKIKEQALNIL
ncbi:YicC/YloC family endoribonuclease [Negadavirga shengliensis]|uniref:YicC/YloC family endoribonuclease n=1 Tax=Negadavirga shengliensis TaxID=1389218 RepID=A0ABV9T5I4_9BACT